MQVEVPFLAANDAGQRVVGIIDLLLETDTGWVIIDHKSFLGRRADWTAKALSYSGQLAMYRDALFRVKGIQPATWIHFAAEGGMAEVLLT
jgi:ATP-dependent helicase/nuclease subunit A